MTVPILGGRPRAFKTVEEIDAAIQYYFDSITRTLNRTEMYDTGETKPVFDKKLGKEVEEPIYKERPVLNNAGEPVKYIDWLQTPTVTGLCLSMGITLETFNQYYNGNHPDKENAQKFSDSCMRAKKIIQEYIESEKLYDKGASKGAQFNLNCNYGWIPKQKNAVVGGDEDDMPIVITALSPEQRQSRIQELLKKRELANNLKALPGVE